MGASVVFNCPKCRAAWSCFPSVRQAQCGKCLTIVRFDPQGDGGVAWWVENGSDGAEGQAGVFRYTEHLTER